MKFRPHRQTLEESLKAEIEVSSLKDITDYFKQFALSSYYNFDTIACNYHCHDDRNIGYNDTYIVTVKTKDDKVVPLGFTNTKL